MSYFYLVEVIHETCGQSKEEGKDQESKQPSTTSGPVYSLNEIKNMTEHDIHLAYPFSNDITKGQISCLLKCIFPIGILGQVWCLIVSIPDLCLLFLLLVIGRSVDFGIRNVKTQISVHYNKC